MSSGADPRGRPWWLGLAALLFAGLALRTPAQVTPPGVISARSHSGQFLVLASRQAREQAPSLKGDTNYVRLDPMLLPVSCERIKQHLWQELGVRGPWSSKVLITLRPAAGLNEVVTLVSDQYRSGWQYRLEMPNVVERTRYVRSIVQVLLLELANRGAGLRSAEIPAWMIEGCCEQLLASSEIEIILRPPNATANGVSFNPTLVSARKANPMEPAHEKLRSQPPLSFENLSWPTPDQWSGSNGEIYRSSAQLFVTELMALPDGRARLLGMLQQLPQYYNWQLAFLKAFNPFFERPLDVEKWWTLRIAYFTGHNFDQTWPEPESREKLLAWLRAPVQVRTATNELPQSSAVSLQSVVGDWQPPLQTQVLEAKMSELAVMRVRLSPPTLAALAEEYRQAIATYLHDREHPGLLLPFRKKAAQQRAAAETIRKLNELDIRFFTLPRTETASLETRSAARPAAPREEISPAPPAAQPVKAEAPAKAVP